MRQALEPSRAESRDAPKLGGFLLFSKEYLQQLSRQTGFLAESLQKQMTILDLLRELSRHPLLGNKFPLTGSRSLSLAARSL